MENIQPGRKSSRPREASGGLVDGATAREKIDRFFAGPSGALPMKEKGEATPRIRDLLEQIAQKQSFEEKKQETNKISSAMP
jgi:hypothetical protein